jgi:hypothetical protein
MMIRVLLLAVFCLLLNQGLAQPSLVPYRKGDLWGYATREGQIVIAPAYERTYLFTGDGLGRVRQNGLFGFIDGKGNMKIKAQFDEATDFETGIASVKLKGRKFCINIDGNEDECNTGDEEQQEEDDQYTGFAVEKDSAGILLILHSTQDTINDRFEDVHLLSRYFFPRKNTLPL